MILQDVLEYINQNYTKQIKLDDVCKTALMARSSFSYIFPRFTGRTFVDYLHHLRIRHAKKLLAATEKSITDVCMECGFTDVTHFGRVFKRIVGCSPREFIRRSKLPEDI